MPAQRERGDIADLSRCRYAYEYVMLEIDESSFDLLSLAKIPHVSAKPLKSLDPEA